MEYAMEIKVKHVYPETVNEVFSEATPEILKEAIAQAVVDLELSLGSTAAECETFSITLLKDDQVIASN